MELHEWLLFFHILAAIVWVGASITPSVIMTRANRGPDRAVVAGLAHELEWVGPFLIGPAALVVIGTGIWIVLIEDWVDSRFQAWQPRRVGGHYWPSPAVGLTTR
jgi:uncharacterized membrane protein